MNRVATIECVTGDARCKPRKRIAVAQRDYALGPDTVSAGLFLFFAELFGVSVADPERPFRFIQSGQSL